MIYKNDSEKRESGCSRPVVVKKESKSRKRKPLQMSWEGGGEREKRQRTVAQGEGIIKVKEIPESHTA